jgi:cytochrome b561
VPPPGTPPWQARAARAGHAALNFLLLSMPMTGAVAWGMASPTAASAHQAGKAALIGLVALHVAAALFGQVMRRDGTLARMLRPGR